MKVSEYLDSKLQAAVDAQLKEIEKREAKDRVIDRRQSTSADDQAVSSKFYKALATGNPALQEEVNDLVVKQYNAKEQDISTIGSGTAGGVLVPTTVADSIVSKMVYISPLRQISTVIENMPAQLQVPSEATLASAYWVAEGAPGTDSGEVFDPNLLTPYKLMGMDSFTSEVLADAATNPSIQNYVERRFAVALALLENGAFVSGSGTGQPFGFRSSAITPNTLAQAGATLAYGDVSGLFYSLGTAYRSQAVWVMSSAGAHALTNVRDNYGRPIWREGLSGANPPTVLGRPAYIVEEIPSNLGTGTNATEIWFGDFKDYYVIGDRGELRVDYGTNGTDFANDKISLRIAKRVAGRPLVGEAFSSLTGVIAS